jgi:hypothetical protein
MTKDEALKMALETLEVWKGYMTHLWDKTDEHTMVAIKEALAQPEQEPVAWMNDSTPSGIFARHMEGAKNFGCTIPLYKTPPQRKPLTDEEIIQVASTPAGSQATTKGYVIPFARAIEAAHGIKGEA